MAWTMGLSLMSASGGLESNSVGRAQSQSAALSGAQLNNTYSQVSNAFGTVNGQTIPAIDDSSDNSGVAENMPSFLTEREVTKLRQKINSILKFAFKSADKMNQMIYLYVNLVIYQKC